MSIASQLHEIQERIHSAAERAHRSQQSVTLVAVSKTFPAEDALACYQAGQRIFGENRVQEALQKMPLLPEDAQWHLIGPLQHNKVRKALGKFSVIESVDSLKLATYMDSVAAEMGIVQDILLEIHVGGEESKFGMEVDELRDNWPAFQDLKHLNIRGLMCIPPPVEDPNDAKPYFRTLRELRDELQTTFGAHLPELSMGMSHDFEAAIEEGATLVRVGSAIFGKRNYQI
jgi:hypothetical protein